MDLFEKVARGRFDPLDEVAPGAPERMRAAIERALSVDLADRPANAAALLGKRVILNNLGIATAPGVTLGANISGIPGIPATAASAADLKLLGSSTAVSNPPLDSRRPSPTSVRRRLVFFFFVPLPRGRTARTRSTESSPSRIGRMLWRISAVMWASG